ncbi:MAG TPA: TetR/AcrR family transcriptional regulator [Stellaceae bacterium]|nr:TetR/AcrR family transcriptional regulator [Stellaceae bacterium]
MRSTSPTARTREAGGPRRGGRPSRLAAAQLGETILDAATELFLSDGYGVTSIESIAKRAGISKRTFYSRYRDKAALFGAVVHRVVERLRPAADTPLFEGGALEETLVGLARYILRAALTPDALALHRVILAEASRFPELAAIVNEQGGRSEAVDGISTLLQRALDPPPANASFAAAQFLQMVVSLPQRRAHGLGTPMTPTELDVWARDTVTLFLNGVRRGPKI